MIDTLFDEIERLREQLYDAELRCALVEAEVREEVMEEMDEDSTLGVFALVPSSETLNHLVRFLSTWSGSE